MPQIRYAKSARRGPRPDAFQLIATGPRLAQHGVIGRVQEVSVQQALRQAVTVVGRAHLVAEPLESLALGRGHLGVDGVEERQGRQQVLTRRALPARVLPARPARAAGRLVVRQRVQPSEKLAHHGEFRRTVGQPHAVHEPRHQDGAAVKVGYGIVDGEPLGGIALPLQEAEDRSVALNPGLRPGRRERASDPRAAVLAVDAEHVGLVHAQLRGSDRVDAVAIPEMSEQPLSIRFVVHARTQTPQIRQRFGVALPGLLSVAPDNLLVAGVLGHRTSLPLTPSFPSDAVQEDGL